MLGIHRLDANTIGPAEPQGPYTVLVVEDEVLLPMALSEHLRDVGFHVLEAASGEEARKIVEAVGGVDVVISDVHMERKEEGIDLGDGSVSTIGTFRSS